MSSDSLRDESIWSDEPPTEPGWYWVRDADGYEKLMKMYSARWWIGHRGAMSSNELAKDFQFGPRVPDAQKCAEIERGSDGN